jgi:hypothetical protein
MTDDTVILSFPDIFVQLHDVRTLYRGQINII